MPLDRLRALLIEDGEAAARLARIGRPADFADAAAALLDDGASTAVRAALTDQLGGGRPASLPIIETEAPAPGWLPWRLDAEGLDWLFIGRRLTQPFYESDLSLARCLPINRLMRVRTPRGRLAVLAGRAPDGLIFHMSRCGSTLTARMLAGSQASRAVAEAKVVDQAVRAPGLDDAARVELLRAVVGALARGGPERLFLKLDCWHARDLPLFRRAFPDAPWVFLHRDPVEVMVSQRRACGIQMIPSLVPESYYGLSLPSGVPDEDYFARVLAAIMEAALDGLELGGGLCVDYRELPEAVETLILPHFGVAPSPAEREAMARVALRDAKGAPQAPFTPDSASKQATADRALRNLCEERLGRLQRRLRAQAAARTSAPATAASKTAWP
ncbi:MAG: aspartyl beta-hydroxylase [Proteobacteria bacterium]|nr:aspartyl beta-hydroxylase [Pseudomonadota bacterium]